MDIVVFITMFSFLSVSVTASFPWMSKIPDDTLISRISIPGTHNSYARYESFQTYGFIQCQEWTVQVNSK